MKTLNLISTALISCLLVACGGGGGGGHSDTPAPSGDTSSPSPPGQGSSSPYAGPQGIFSVPNPIFKPTITFLENGELYAVDLIGGRVAGFFHGPVEGSSILATSSKLTEYNAMDGGMLQDASLNANYSAPAISVTLTFPFGTFTGSADGQKPYSSADVSSIYDKPIAITDLAGTYNGEMSNVGATMPIYSPISGLALNTDGHFTVTAGGCTFNGIIVNHADKGVFDVSATVNGGGCQLPADMKGLLTPMEYSATTTTLAFQLLSLDARKSAVLYVDKV